MPQSGSSLAQQRGRRRVDALGEYDPSFKTHLLGDICCAWLRTGSLVALRNSRARTACVGERAPAPGSRQSVGITCPLLREPYGLMYLAFLWSATSLITSFSAFLSRDVAASCRAVDRYAWCLARVTVSYLLWLMPLRGEGAQKP